MLSEESLARAFSNLREEVGHLASDPAAQKAYLQKIGTWDSLDELALEFDHSYQTLNSAGRLSEVQALAFGLLSAELGRMSGPENAELWHGDDGLQRSEWSAIRRLASEALRCLD
jgi:hypothetical protein